MHNSFPTFPPFANMSAEHPCASTSNSHQFETIPFPSTQRADVVSFGGSLPPIDANLYGNEECSVFPLRSPDYPSMPNRFECSVQPLWNGCVGLVSPAPTLVSSVTNVPVHSFPPFHDRHDFPFSGSRGTILRTFPSTEQPQPNQWSHLDQPNDPIIERPQSVNGFNAFYTPNYNTYTNDNTPIASEYTVAMNPSRSNSTVLTAEDDDHTQCTGTTASPMMAGVTMPSIPSNAVSAVNLGTTDNSITFNNVGAPISDNFGTSFSLSNESKAYADCGKGQPQYSVPAPPLAINTSIGSLSGDDLSAPNSSKRNEATSSDKGRDQGASGFNARPQTNCNDRNNRMRSSEKKTDDDSKPYKCTYSGCGKSYKHYSSMRSHYIVHTDDACVCDICGHRFSYPSKLEAHRRKHVKDKPYQCQYPGCEFKSGDRSNLRRHKRIHTGVKPFACRFCDKRFSDQTALVSHERRTHTKIKPFQCRYCDKSFVQSSDRTSHERVHSNDRPFPCDQCSKRFKRKSDLKKHLSTHRSKK